MGCVPFKALFSAHPLALSHPTPQSFFVHIIQVSSQLRLDATRGLKTS